MGVSERRWVCDDCGLSFGMNPGGPGEHRDETMTPCYGEPREYVPAPTRGAVNPSEVALLREIAASGVEHDDERIGYVTVQIDRVTWNELSEWVGKRADAVEAVIEALSGPQRGAVSAELDFGEDNAGHDTDCDCKACLIDTRHAEVEELREENKALRDRIDALCKAMHEADEWMARSSGDVYRRNMARVVLRDAWIENKGT